MRKNPDTTVTSQRHASRNLQTQFSTLPSAGAPITRAALLDRQADLELVMGHLGVAERLAHLAAELRSATA